MKSFNRKRDSFKIKSKIINWDGPYSFDTFEKLNNLPSLPESCGVYLFTSNYKDAQVIYGLGITKQLFKNRIRQHRYKYKAGKYNVLDIKALKQGFRKEIWHGWKYAKNNQEEYKKRKEEIILATNNQLEHTKIFIAEIKDKREQERIEASITYHLYISKGDHSDIIDRGMHLKGRYNYEMPILITNLCNQKIYGLPQELEI